METEGSKSSPRAEEPRDGAPVRADLVLLVDDDPVARLLTASALAERNWRVIEADGGASALELFANNQPDVVVLDALMPEVDGFITCERLRRRSGRRARAGADADRPRRRDLYRARVRGRRDRLLRQEHHAVDAALGTAALHDPRLAHARRACRKPGQVVEGAAHRAAGQLGMGHRRALGEAFRGVLRDRRPAAAGGRAGGLVRLVARCRG